MASGPTGAVKRDWQRPALVVLARSRPEENVLAACKSVTVWQGPNSSNVACIIFCGGTRCSEFGTS